MIDKALLKKILFILGAIVLCAAPFAYVFFPAKEIIPAKPKREIPAETGQIKKKSQIDSQNQSGLSTLELLRKQREELRLKNLQQEPVSPPESMPPAELPGMPYENNPEAESAAPESYNQPEMP